MLWADVSCSVLRVAALLVNRYPSHVLKSLKYVYLLSPPCALVSISIEMHNVLRNQGRVKCESVVKGYIETQKNGVSAPCEV